MIATERWYVTEAGDEVVRHGDPRARRLLVAAGSYLDDATARKFGILEESKASYQEKAMEAAPENKALEMSAPKPKRKPTKK